MIVDRRQIAYAIEQLLRNASDAVDRRGAIHIRANLLHTEPPNERCGVNRSSNYAVVTIADNGRGMAKETIARIFDPSYTGDGHRRRPGLGLSAAAGIIKSHGGYIQVRSNPGEGSVFKVYLPVPAMAPLT